MKKKKIIIVLLICLGLLIAGVYFFKKPALEKETPKHDICLTDNEIVDYTIDERYAKEVKIPSVPTTIFIKDKSSGAIHYSFIIDNFFPLIRVQKCGVYVVRQFAESDYTYNDELWRYDYSGEGAKIFTLASFKNKKPEGVLYGTAFTIDSQERYVTLERGYLDQPDYGLVIKDLKTLNDLFVLTHNDIKNINAEVVLGILANGIQRGGLDIGRWTNDGKYLWGTMFNGALDTAYYRIEMGTWKTEVFSPPPDLPSGAERATSFAGFVAYADFPTFFGIDVIAKQKQEKFIKEGRVKHLYLYNLRTKEKKLLAGTMDPAQRFNIKWLSDTEFEYEMPGGEKKIYKIEL